MKHNSVVLSISNKGLNCQEIVQHLKSQGIAGCVTSNKSVIKTQQGMKVEDGCRIIFNEIDRNQLENDIWKPIAEKHKLKCAHLIIPSKFSDCIHNYFNQKKCQ